VLTKKDLLNYKKSKGNIIPSFVKSDDLILNQFSESIVSLFSNSLGQSRANLEQESVGLLSAFEMESIVQKGFLKLLTDRITFESSFDGNISEFRNSVFINSNEYLHSKKELILHEYKSNISNELNFKNEELEYLLYSDLPEYNKVTKFKEISPTSLINKYNVALVQGLLFYCEYVQISIPLSECTKADLRYLLKQIRFFQLSVQINKNDDYVEIQLDGPLSLFLHTQKYGFNLAAFFPAIVLLKKWELEAKIEMGKSAKQQGVLKLNQNSPLISHYKLYSSYIPEDFLMFESLFLEKNLEWKILPECDDILYDGKNYFFPDFKFVNNKKNVYLELFHSWHKQAVKQRIQNLEKDLSYSLIIGVSKVLLKDNEIKSIVENSNLFKNKGFIFREIPTVSQVIEKLSYY
jgi:uncharacterized protein